MIKRFCDRCDKEILSTGYFNVYFYYTHWKDNEDPIEEEYCLNCATDLGIDVETREMKDDEK